MKKTARSLQLPPHNLETERAVLGTMFLEPEVLPRALELLTPGDFFKEAHRQIFQAIRGVVERRAPVDLLTVQVELDWEGTLAEVGGAAALAVLVEEATVTAHFDSYVEILRGLAVKRDLLQLAAQLSHEITNGAGTPELLAFVEGRTREIGNRLGRCRPLRPADLTDFMANAPEPAELLFEDLPLHRGLVGWIVALMKVGKSLAALALLLALSTGGLWLGRFKASRRFRVLYVQEEDGPRRVHRRVERLLRGEGLPTPEPGWFRLLVRAGLRLDDPDAWRRFLEEARAFRPEVVIFDVWDTLQDQDDSRRELIRPTLRRLRELADELDAAVFVLDHTRKTDASGKDLASPGAKQRGSGAKWGWSEQSLYLDPQGRGAFAVTLETKDGPALEPFLVRIVDTDDGGLRLVYEGPVAAKMSRAEQNRRRVFDALEEIPRSLAVIRERVGMGEKTVRTHLDTLRRDGLAEAVPDPEDPRGQRHLWLRKAQDDSQEAEDGPPF